MKIIRKPDQILNRYSMRKTSMSTTLNSLLISPLTSFLILSLFFSFRFFPFLSMILSPTSDQSLIHFLICNWWWGSFIDYHPLGERERERNGENLISTFRLITSKRSRRSTVVTLAKSISLPTTLSLSLSSACHSFTFRFLFPYFLLLEKERKGWKFRPFLNSKLRVQ